MSFFHIGWSLSLSFSLKLSVCSFYSSMSLTLWTLFLFTSASFSLADVCLSFTHSLSLSLSLDEVSLTHSLWHCQSFLSKTLRISLSPSVSPDTIFVDSLFHCATQSHTPKHLTIAQRFLSSSRGIRWLFLGKCRALTQSHLARFLPLFLSVSLSLSLE